MDSLLQAKRKNKEWGRTKVDTTKWKAYQLISAPKRNANALMSGDLGEVIVTGCGMPLDIGIFASLYLNAGTPASQCKADAMGLFLSGYAALSTYPSNVSLAYCESLFTNARLGIFLYQQCMPDGTSPTNPGNPGGGGNGGGEGEGGYADEPLTIGTVELNGVRDPDFPSNCAAWFYHPASNGTYQTCGVTGISFDWITSYIGADGKEHIDYVRLHFDKTLFFEFPRTRANGDLILLNEAARLSALAKIWLKKF